MDDNVYQSVLEFHPKATVKISFDGSLIFANAEARALFQISKSELHHTNFYDLFSENSELMRENLRRCGGSSSWLPVRFEIAHGNHAGMQIIFLARGMPDPGTGRTNLVIVTDENQVVAFQDHSRLVAELNSALAQERHLKLELERALEKEERLHRELVHRVKNNLNVLSTLVRASELKTNNPDVEKALEEISNRILAIAIVHEILDAKQEISVVDAKELIEKLCNSLEHSLCPPNISIERDLVNYPLHVSDATPLCLLINELITNSLKHAFTEKERGRVQVTLKRNGVDKVEVHVNDDGAGFDVETSEMNSGSLIVQSLAEQLNGDLDVHFDAGTSWQLIFPPQQ